MYRTLTITRHVRKVKIQRSCTTFLIYKSDTMSELPIHNCIFQHSRRRCPNIYQVLEPASVSAGRISLPPALWITSWLLLAPHHRRRTSFGEFTALLRHILPIHNVTVNSNNLFVNFRWTFTFCVEKSYEGKHFAFGGIWIGAAVSNTSHSNKAGSTTVKRARLTGKGSRSTANLP